MDYAVNWEAISAIGQIVGAIAVVISLIYVAREVRSSAHATQLASRHSMEDIFIRWAQQLADNQNLREVYYRGLQDFESLEGADLVGFGVLVQGMFRLYEEAYYRHLEGHLDARVWYGWEAAMRRPQRISGSSGLVAFTLPLVPWGFCEDINQLQQTAKARRIYGEPMKDE